MKQEFHHHHIYTKMINNNSLKCFYSKKKKLNTALIMFAVLRRFISYTRAHMNHI